MQYPCNVLTQTVLPSLTFVTFLAVVLRMQIWGLETLKWWFLTIKIKKLPFQCHTKNDVFQDISWKCEQKIRIRCSILCNLTPFFLKFVMVEVMASKSRFSRISISQVLKWWKSDPESSQKLIEIKTSKTNALDL